MPKTFETFDHTADVGLTAYGRDLPELFQNAALGVMSLVVDPATAAPGGIRDRVRAQALDRETLLVNWLNEVLFLFGVQREVFCRFHILRFNEGPGGVSIEAEGEGELFDPGRHGLLREVKAATFHDLKVERDGEGWKARIVLDV